MENGELWNGGNISHKDTKAQRENRSQRMYADTPHSFTDSCIIFITFMNFMVKCNSLMISCILKYSTPA